MGGISVPEWLVGTLSILGVMLIIFGPTVLAGLWEKRSVWPYVPIGGPGPARPVDFPDEENPYAVGRTIVDVSPIKLTEYAANVNKMANLMGFEPVGVFKDGDGRLYRIRYDFWRSKKGNVLALVGGGTLAGLPVRNTWLFTRLVDGRCLVTLSDQKASEIDLAGIAVEALIDGADFAKLLDWHRARLVASPVPAAPYSETDPLANHLEFRTRRIDRLAELGLAYYLEPGQTAWRYTLRGALSLSFRGILQGIRRVLWPDTRRGPSR